MHAVSTKSSHPSQQKRYVIAAILFVLIGIVRIVATYPVFNQTIDEPAHIAAGMEWIDHGSYRYETQHPPLARIMTAIGPYLAGVRLSGEQKKLLDEVVQEKNRNRLIEIKEGKEYKAMWASGNEILGSKEKYFRNLSLARMGILPFFLFAAVIVWMWTKRLFGQQAASIATLILTFLPPVLAHAGLATTDMAFTASYMAAIFTFTLWLDKPDRLHSILVGLTWALAISCKFSSFVFLPTTSIAIVLARWILKRVYSKDQPDQSRIGLNHLLKSIGIAAFVGFFLIWSVYRFSLGAFTPPGTGIRTHQTVNRLLGEKGILHDMAVSAIENRVIPAPELFNGILVVRKHNLQGHWSYLLGEVRNKGWWYYFPLVLIVKSPIPFLIFSGIGCVLLWQLARREKSWEVLAPIVCAFTLLIISMPVHINIGVRHILPIYPLLCMVAGFAFIKIWQFRKQRMVGRVVGVVLMSWYLGASAMAHPDYLPYFNELAGGQSEKIVVDSNLDWGQDWYRLKKELGKRGITQFKIGFYSTISLDVLDFKNIEQLQLNTPTTGWIAISINLLKRGERGNRGGNRDAYKWLDTFDPVTVVGKTIRLYHIKEA